MSNECGFSFIPRTAFKEGATVTPTVQPGRAGEVARLPPHTCQSVPASPLALFGSLFMAFSVSLDDINFLPEVIFTLMNLVAAYKFLSSL